ncbi:MAG: NAD(P)/FAD-dependent oxidoreductase [Actinomycetota bacterium]
MKKKHELVIIGAGPAGLAAAYRSSLLGIEDIVLVEREQFLGGILPQCIHAGFGLKEFGKELTGPEYAQIFIDRVRERQIEVKLDTMALSIGRENEVALSSKRYGFYEIGARAVILALGCRERTRGAISIPGTRPAGIYTAGVVQRMINMEGYLPGKRAAILGSGDIGLIMARRLVLEGCRVEGVFELMPFSTGLKRNIAQCLEDFNIPLYLNSTVTNICGEKRLEAVEVTDMRSSKKRNIGCDTLLLSVGLIPENELSETCGIEMDSSSGGPLVDQDFSTSREGIFSCGNSLFVNDLADDVSRDAYVAAESAVNYIKGRKREEAAIRITKGNGINQVVPQKISAQRDVELKIRVAKPYEKAAVVIESIGFRRIKKYLSPGELVFLTIRKRDFDKYNLKDRENLVLGIEEI